MAAGVFDVFVLGEVHDNPAHHAEQARRVAEIDPAALVFEMLTEAQAARALPALRGDAAALGAALDWAASGWPAFAMYAPIFAAAPEARVYGAAVPRTAARAAMERGVAAVFGKDAARYGLTSDLPEAEQAAREALQQAAHCGTLPQEMLPAMVRVQRLRDASLARAVVLALQETGGPVAVITGNGHARRDWGLPRFLTRVAPDARVFVLLQGEDGVVPEGGHDAVVFAPSVPRDDPCAAFR
ncbi:ChaN family lipoprotein [Marinovum sp.]|uniref:ChaN family lipoprotein n=1 Tax=Marinovum sp. TaxID=2024839 RepID=UPI002B2774ED|nr:ChaN family lipoprotein [Marinovum sp.]